MGNKKPQLSSGLGLYLKSILFDPLKASVGNQRGGYTNAIRGLMVLQQGGDDAGQGQGAAVQGVGQNRFTVLSFDATLQAIGLEGLKVGGGTDI